MPLERAVNRIASEFGDAEPVVNLLGKAIYDWTKTRHGYAGVTRTHAAFNKVRTFIGVPGTVLEDKILERRYTSPT